MSFVGFHIGRVEGLGLVTPSGTSPIIEVRIGRVHEHQRVAEPSESFKGSRLRRITHGQDFMLGTTIAGLTALAALPATDALAQTKAAVGGMVTLKLTDPGGGEPWRIQRRLLRTFSTMQECEMQKNSFIGFHVGQVERHGLVTASGAPPVVEVRSIECFTVREDS